MTPREAVLRSRREEAPPEARPDPVRQDFEELVPLARAAAILGVSIKTLHNRLNVADPGVLALRPTKLLGRWKFPVSALHEAIERGRQAATGRVPKSLLAMKGGRRR